MSPRPGHSSITLSPHRACSIPHLSRIMSEVHWPQSLFPQQRSSPPRASAPQGTLTPTTRPHSRGAGGQKLRRMALLYCLLTARSVRSLAAEICRRLLLGTGWLCAPGRHPRLTSAQHALGFPLRRWHLLAGALLSAKALHCGWRLLRWLAIAPPRRALEERLRSSTSYNEWLEALLALDNAHGGGYLCQRGKAQVPDSKSLQARSARLRVPRSRGDVTRLIHELRVDLARHAGHVRDGDGDMPCPLELLRPLQEFIEEVKASLTYVEACPELTIDEKLTFLRELRHAYGRTGLLLSGGGSFGFFHFGVWKVLVQANALPRVLAGSSAGAIAAAMLCIKTDEELEAAVHIYPNAWTYTFFAHDTQLQQVKHLLFKGTLQDHEVFQRVLQGIFGDTTFEEAYQRTGRILNISVTPFDTREPYRLLNYLTAPSVLIRSAVAASSAFPLLFQPTDLLTKTRDGRIVRHTPEGSTQLRRWCDGSIQADLPMQGLREMFNVNSFIVSQCNPYLIPLVGFKRWLPHRLAVLWETEFKHRCRQLLHFFPTSHMLSLLSQPWEGDVSMVLPFTTFPFKRAAFNLTRQELKRAMQEGQLATWAKLSAIQSSTAIEVAIDESLQRTTAQAAARQLAARSRLSAAGVRRSLPSWLHMPALGIPAVASRDELRGRGSATSSRAASRAELPEEAAEPAGTLSAAPMTPRCSLDKARRGSGGRGEGAIEEAEAEVAGARALGAVGGLGATAAQAAQPRLRQEENGSTGRGQHSAAHAQEMEGGVMGHSHALPASHHQGATERGGAGGLDRPVEGAVELAAGALLLPHQAAGVEDGPGLWMDLVLLGSVSAGASALDVVAP